MKLLNEIYDEMLDENFTGLDKWEHHLEIYDELLPKAKPAGDDTLGIVNISESVDSSILFYRYIQNWNVHPDNLRFIHIHKNPKDTASLTSLGIKVMQGDVEDDAFLRKVASSAGAFNILIDDTCYTNSQRSILLRLYPRMSDSGLLFVEDTYLNYRKEYVTSKPSFVDYIQTAYRNLDDWYNNAMQDKQFQLPMARRDKDFSDYRQMTPFGLVTKSINLYSGMVVIEKADIQPPYQKVRKW